MVKKKEIRKLISKEKLDFICLQETKLEIVESRLCQYLWGSSDLDWVFKTSEGRSGGILSIWSNKTFQRTDLIVGDGFLCVKGLWGGNQTQCAIVNVYSLCSLEKKKELRRNLEQLMGDDGDRKWCILGDFNAVRKAEERKESGVSICWAEINGFDDFIEENNLIDLPLSGREFTCYKPNATARSRIDRILVRKLGVGMGEFTQWGLRKDVSDHCPVLLKQLSVDWGPKPFRVLDCWQDHPDFPALVRETWNSIEIEGLQATSLKKNLRN